MNDQSNNFEISDNNSMENPIDTIGDAISGIPAPIRKNLFIALNQLCTALIDIPVAYLEGKAAENRAETSARITMINTAAEQMAKQMNIDPQYSQIAANKYGQKILREQINLDMIGQNALKELSSAQSPQSNSQENKSAQKEISVDWLNSFEEEARHKTSDEMRLLFGKILAGEISKPSSYSIKTVRLISQLDNQAAKIFQTFCSLCISL